MGKVAKVETLELCERAIDAALQSIQSGFREVAATVARVREGELWRQGGHQSLADWGKKKYGWTRQRGQQLASAHSILLALPENLTTMVVNERQVRAIAAVPDEKRVNVLDRAVAKGKVTAKSIEVAAQELEPEAVESETPEPEIEVLPEVVTSESGCAQCVEKDAEIERLLAVIAERNEGEIPLDELVDEDELPAAPGPVKNCTCRHSEHLYSPATARFASANRYATICPGCLEGGHVNGMAEHCGMCQSGFAA